MSENPSLTMHALLTTLKEALQNIAHELNYFELIGVTLDLKFGSRESASAKLVIEPIKLGTKYATERSTAVSMTLRPPSKNLGAADFVAEQFSRSLIAVLIAANAADSGDTPLICDSASIKVAFVITQENSLEVLDLKGADWWASIGGTYAQAAERAHSITLQVKPR